MPASEDVCFRVCLVDSCAPGNLLQSLMPLLRDRQVSTLGLPRLVEITKQTVGFKGSTKSPKPHFLAFNLCLLLHYMSHTGKEYETSCW